MPSSGPVADIIAIFRMLFGTVRLTYRLYVLRKDHKYAQSLGLSASQEHVLLQTLVRRLNNA